MEVATSQQSTSNLSVRGCALAVCVWTSLAGKWMKNLPQFPRFKVWHTLKSCLNAGMRVSGSVRLPQVARLCGWSRHDVRKCVDS